MAQVALIPDASVAAKWLLDEPDSPLARDLRDMFLREELRFAVPSLLYYEVANALRYSNAVTPRKVEEFLQDLHDFEMDEVGPSPGLSLRAVQEARALGTTVYDATYLALAKELDGVVVTADARFQRRARGRHVATLEQAHADLVR